MALVLLKRKLPGVWPMSGVTSTKESLVDCLVNTDNVVWAQSEFGGDDVLIKVLEGPDLHVQGPLEAIRKVLSQ